MGDRLCAITNAQDRQLAMVFFKVEPGGVLLPYRIWTAGKNDAFYAAVNFRKMIERMDLAVDVELPDTARYQLGKLRAEVKNEDFFLHGQR